MCDHFFPFWKKENDYLLITPYISFFILKKKKQGELGNMLKLYNIYNKTYIYSMLLLIVTWPVLEFSC
ncbi:hypothetical protein EUGRSUZ_E01376 [Eucalyptus grandis]|uniref:Uncharacterized protein n=2 Tax=Eucalyptus grandis TaxID=71139 RepID=A0A059C455_EUCGR|nr:hypothetical protein EUGRSUZ_E01376 [Eucalyptus grandis]